MPVFALLVALAVTGCDSKENANTGILGPLNGPSNEGRTSILGEINAIPSQSPTPVPIPDEILNLSPYPTPIVIAPTATPRPSATPTPSATPVPQRIQSPASGKRIVENARKYIGTIEKPGNRGKLIDEWNRLAGVPLGSPYCGSYAGAMHIESEVTPPKGYAYTPSWFTGKRNISWSEAKPGDVIGFYYPNMGRIAHIAILEQYGETFTKTIEANTSYDARTGTASDRDGDGVHAKLRNTKILRQERNKVARYW